MTTITRTQRPKNTAELSKIDNASGSCWLRLNRAGVDAAPPATHAAGRVSASGTASTTQRIQLFVQSLLRATTVVGRHSRSRQWTMDWTVDAVASNYPLLNKQRYRVVTTARARACDMFSQVKYRTVT